MWHSQTQHFFVFSIPDICQFWYTTGLHQECKKSLQKSHISPRRVQRLEKNATPLVLAVLTNISYGVHIVWLEDMSFVIQKYCAFVLIKKYMSWSWNKLQQQNFEMKVWNFVRTAYSAAEIEIKHELSYSKMIFLILN